MWVTVVQSVTGTVTPVVLSLDKHTPKVTQCSLQESVRLSPFLLLPLHTCEIQLSCMTLTLTSVSF